MPEWPLVLPDDDGIRPAGKPDQCFYCEGREGEPHAQDCVIVSKVIIARYIIEIPVRVPHYWGKDDFEFHRNESSSCANNVIEFDMAKAVGSDGCLCSLMQTEWVREHDTTPVRHTQAESREDDKLVRRWGRDEDEP